MNRSRETIKELIVQGKDDGALDEGTSSGGRKENGQILGFWVYFEGGSNRIPQGLGVQYERKRIIKDDYKGFGLEEGS